MNVVGRAQSHWTLAERLAHYSAPAPNGCRLWIGARDNYGYGMLSWQGRSRRAHRLSWESVNGPIPKGMGICHRCDTPACIEEKHLFPGTQATNNADMAQKGRARNGGAHGSAHGQAKMTEAKAMAVYLACGSQDHIARAFGISRATVGRIKRRDNWRHIHAAGLGEAADA
jgi:hypothetical protein